jgi:hypothetical protein
MQPLTERAGGGVGAARLGFFAGYALNRHRQPDLIGNLQELGEKARQSGLLVFAETLDMVFDVVKTGGT